MDRENADVTVVILDNGSYGVLSMEYTRMTGNKPGEKAQSMFDLASRDGRGLDFAKMAQGMGVEAVKATTCGEFCEAFKKGMETKGPYLIQAVVRTTKPAKSK